VRAGGDADDVRGADDEECGADGGDDERGADDDDGDGDRHGGAAVNARSRERRPNLMRRRIVETAAVRDHEKCRRK
jgi:hypothetical protein